MQAGQGKAAALRQAQLSLIEEGGDHAEPYYWAAFVLSGDGGEIGLETGVQGGGEVEAPGSGETEEQESEETQASGGAREQLLWGWLVLGGVLIVLVAGEVLWRRRSH